MFVYVIILYRSYSKSCSWALAASALRISEVLGKAGPCLLIAFCWTLFLSYEYHECEKTTYPFRVWRLKLFCLLLCECQLPKLTCSKQLSTEMSKKAVTATAGEATFISLLKEMLA